MITEPGRSVDSGLKDELVLGDPNAPRFVLWNGKLRPVPSKLTDMPFLDLMSFPGKIKVGFRAIGLCPPPPGHEESVEDFVRRIDDEVFEGLIEPFCSGAYPNHKANRWIIQKGPGNIA
ncbi:protoporphyrinogen oxidase chloroplastic [Phtheirospermum japonicum]|uniref:Protoporphyrinogen oxidase chloroplastic n=1 Tax=Phtheirospermum japonicum TaxID=374723 RepID=A0A830CQE0_9LAMI|nr:protoporphyrinogen oxidase chloroplastic [Phtheirospermum japonicum]